ncbi:fimbrial biogenesis chaperone [Acinetobacter larvae]|uniref:Pili assembly chaperone N-terminal domain-containing protein n=1 Tax=Acinetobacter larvae TaxID=1789224 RepID=A0A1B2M3E3_9GAMM|nr:molecular chaperone [Acinetobacter larvae]AOA59718.1 hypothetical protein BFG52_16100 [Acinetobacter larvae]
MRINICLVAGLAMMMLCSHVQAGILASKTRLLFQAPQTYQHLMLVNTNHYPILLQTWVDQGAADPETPHMPFLVVPPLAKMSANAIQSIRIIYNDQLLAQDRESVFWLNLYEMPYVKTAMTEQSTWLSLAMNTQLKIFYRPKTLAKMTLSDLAQHLKFYLIQHQGQWLIRCDNRTAYHASFLDLQLLLPSQRFAAQQVMDMMSYPFSQKDYLFSAKVTSKLSSVLSTAQVQFSLVDDQGQIHSFTRPIHVLLDEGVPDNAVQK